MDALYAAGIHGHALTAIQAWKDVLLARRVRPRRVRRAACAPPSVPPAASATRSRSRSPRSSSLYALIPQDALGGHATHKAIAYALRHDLAGVGAYFLGRAVVPRMRDVRWLVLAAAAAVAAWGLVDAYAIHLDWWRHNGTVDYFRNQLGFDYGPGLSHLPRTSSTTTGTSRS